MTKIKFFFSFNISNFIRLLYFSNAAAYVNFFILPIIVTLMWSGNIGLAIRNLIKEKEKFIEEVI